MRPLSLASIAAGSAARAAHRRGAFTHQLYVAAGSGPAHLAACPGGLDPSHRRTAELSDICQQKLAIARRRAAVDNAAVVRAHRRESHWSPCPIGAEGRRSMISIRRPCEDRRRSGCAPLIPHYRSGALRFLAQTSETRSPSLPDVPTYREAGIADLRPRPVVRRVRAGQDTRRDRAAPQWRDRQGSRRSGGPRNVAANRAGSGRRQRRRSSRRPCGKTA